MHIFSSCTASAVYKLTTGVLLEGLPRFGHARDALRITGDAQCTATFLLIFWGPEVGIFQCNTSSVDQPVTLHSTVVKNYPATKTGNPPPRTPAAKTKA